IGGAEGEEKQRLIAEVAKVSAELKELEPQLGQVEAGLADLLARTPNLPHESAPDGFTDEDAVEVRRHGEPPTFDFEPKDHALLGERLGMLDGEGAGWASGPRGPVPRGGDVRRRVPPDGRGEHLRHDPRRAVSGRYVGGLARRVPCD